MKPTERTLHLGAALVVFALGLWAQDPAAFVGLEVEDGLYFVAAKSFVLGQGLHLVHVPGAPLATVVSPAYPALLGLAGWIVPSFPEVLPLVHLLNAGAYAVAAFLGCVLLARLRWPVWGAVTTVVLLCGLPVMLGRVVVASPIPLFLALWFGLLILTIDRVDTRFRTILAGLLSVGLTATLAIGFVVAIATALACAIEKRRDLFVSIAAGIGATSLALIWLWASSTPLHDVQLLLDAARRIEPREVLGLLGGAVTPSENQVVVNVMGIVLGILAALGLIWLWRTTSAVVLNGLGVTACFMFWPNASRTWVPLLLVLAVPLAILAVVRMWGIRRSTRVPVALVATVLLVLYVITVLDGVVNRRFVPDLNRQAPHLLSALTSLADETPTNAIIATDLAETVHLYTGRLTVPVMMPPARPWDTLCELGVTHVALLRGYDQPLNSVDVLNPQFIVRDGPTLHELRCSS